MNDSVEVTIRQHTARITENRGEYIATFLDGPFAGNEVTGPSVTTAWNALRDLMRSFEQHARPSLPLRTP